MKMLAGGSGTRDSPLVFLVPTADRTFAAVPAGQWQEIFCPWHNVMHKVFSAGEHACLLCAKRTAELFERKWTFKTLYGIWHPSEVLAFFIQPDERNVLIAFGMRHFPNLQWQPNDDYDSLPLEIRIRPSAYCDRVGVAADIRLLYVIVVLLSCIEGEPYMLAEGILAKELERVAASGSFLLHHENVAKHIGVGIPAAPPDRL